MTTTANGNVATIPVSVPATTLLEVVEHEARAYRAQGSPEAAFLAEQLDRLAQLIAWTGATTAAEFRDRLAVWDAEIADRHFDRGYGEGHEAGRQVARRPA